ncbi:MAG: hypothetical protein IJQ73_06995 [Kiritimatiellae bacterium]|nr:hypothetical protein [Kiritimatiellia bacterium]
MQFDLDHGAKNLAPDILRIENEVPYEKAEAKVCGLCSAPFPPGYIAQAGGELSQNNE